MSTRTPTPPGSSTFAASPLCSFLKAGRSPSKSSARSPATRSRKPFSATSYKLIMPEPIGAGRSQTPRRTCHWAQSGILARYHDEEWGVPVHDDRRLFEFLILEGAQAGLSWETVLRKRERYREVFDGFDASKIARYDARKARALLADPGIIRNRLKISSTISNARKFLEVQREFGSFDAYIWQFTGGETLRRLRRGPGDVPASA